MVKILIVEDEPNMRMGLRDNLEFEGYEISIAEDGEKGLKMIREKQYNLIILDVMMPKMSGFDVCKTIRKEGVQTPVILLTAKGEEIDKVLGLELGADDYVTKPFSLRELLARVKAVLRRVETSINTNVAEAVIGKLTVHFTGYQAYEPARQPGGEGIPVQMSHKEFEILHYLWKKRNQTVSRDELLNNIWGYDENPATRTVDNFIMKIRNRIEKDPNHPQIILTVHGIGYKLVSCIKLSENSII